MITITTLQTIGVEARRLAAGLVLVVALVGCDMPGAPAAPTPTPPTPTPVPTPLPPTATPPPRPVPGVSFQNPVLRENFADPDILAVDGVYYGYATNASGKNIPLARSSDLVTWELLSDAMPGMAPWAKPGGSKVWAPEVIPINGRYNMYYTARDQATNKQCVGVAVADKPEGKFKDTSAKPLVCQADEGGTIDASPFRDGDKLYLYYKNDGNCCGITTYLYVQEMAPDGLSLVGQPTRLVQNDAFWEGRVVEAPTMFKREDKYYLFFSANDYAGDPYAVGYATCHTAVGPCQDAPENPILKSRMTQQPLVVGPGHQDIIEVKGETWIVYHAWEIAAGLRGDRRLMWIDKLTWEDGKPHVQGPTVDPQPLPLP